MRDRLIKNYKAAAIELHALRKSAEFMRFAYIITRGEGATVNDSLRAGLQEVRYIYHNAKRGTNLFATPYTVVHVNSLGLATEISQRQSRPYYNNGQLTRFEKIMKVAREAKQLAVDLSGAVRNDLSTRRKSFTKRHDRA